MVALLHANETDSSLGHTTGHLEGDLETFPDIFVATENGILTKISELEI